MTQRILHRHLGLRISFLQLPFSHLAQDQTKIRAEMKALTAKDGGGSVVR